MFLNVFYESLRITFFSSRLKVPVFNINGATLFIFTTDHNAIIFLFNFSLLYYDKFINVSIYKYPRYFFCLKYLITTKKSKIYIFLLLFLIHAKIQKIFSKSNSIFKISLAKKVHTSSCIIVLQNLNIFRLISIDNTTLESIQK